MNTIATPDDVQSIPDPLQNFQGSPPPQLQSFVAPSATPAWQASLTGQNEKVSEGIVGQVAQEAQFNRSQAAFKNLLDNGKQLAENAKEEAGKSSARLSDGRTFADYIPDERSFKTPHGQFDGYNYYRHVLAAAIEFRKDLAADQATQTKQQQTQQRNMFTQDRLGLAQKKADLQEKMANHKITVDELHHQSELMKNEIADYNSKTQRANTGIAAAKLKNDISLKIDGLNKDVEDKIAESDKTIAKAQNFLKMEQLGEKDADGNLLPPDPDKIEIWQTAVKAAQSHKTELQNIKLGIKDFKFLGDQNNNTAPAGSATSNVQTARGTWGITPIAATPHQ
jgi:hypothetical protein